MPEDTLPCRLCGEETPAKEIIKNSGDCDYCALANERSERYAEQEHPDKKG